MMNKRSDSDSHNLRHGAVFAGLAFLASFGFFLILYPYHLIRREQLNLFVYDWDYIAMRFRGIGWLSRLLGSFAEQFFCSRFLAALIIALLLTAIGAVAFRICRKFLGGRASLAIAALVFAWSFMRECGNIYMTRYTIATLGFLSLILLALNFKTALGKSLAAVSLVCLGVWTLGAPCHDVYGKLWGVPHMGSERMFALDTEVVREDWDRVIDLSKRDLYSAESSNCYNLAVAMKGQLGYNLMNISQSGDPYYFLPFVSADQNIFSNCLAGEQWYRLGDMTIAEQSSITCLQASPEHTGARFIQRLALVNTITGQKATAQKYLNLLSRTLFYRKWAKGMLDGTMTEDDAARIERARANMVSSDAIHHANAPRRVLLALLEANPDNIPAREYLLCHDLLRYDLEQFAEDYDRYRVDGSAYKEALIIWLGDRVTSKDVLESYGIEDRYMKRLESFNRYPNNYPNTYWYYYLRAIQESEQ